MILIETYIRCNRILPLLLPPAGGITKDTQIELYTRGFRLLVEAERTEILSILMCKKEKTGQDRRLHPTVSPVKPCWL